MPSCKDKKHLCKLGLGSDSMLPEEVGQRALICRYLKKLGQVSQHHPDTFDRFYSYPAVMAERQRQLYEGVSYLSHPLSLFSLSWKTFMCVINTSHMCLSTFRLCYIVDRTDLVLHYNDGVIMALDAVCWLDIILNFNMGYIDKKSAEIVMDWHLIAYHYLRTWFISDLVSSLPVAQTLLLTCPHRRRCVLAGHYMRIVRATRIYSVCIDLKVFMKLFTSSYIWHVLVRHTVLFAVTAHWCSCLIYLPPVHLLYWNGQVPPDYNSFLDTSETEPGGLLNFSVGDRYRKSIFIALSAFFGTGFSMFQASNADEILVHSLIILYSAMFMVYNFVLFLKIYLTVYNSTTRYNAMLNQVEAYMRLKQFSCALKKRVRAFYWYRYQEKYFCEEQVLQSLSEELRNEITLHSCYKLVNKVALFKGVSPAVMGSILGSLRPEVYLPDESVLQAGDVGECMYFVASGTVAVYSLKGAEVCHLEDGAHFGEVALLMKDCKRVATVVAIEITLLYRLDAQDFKLFVLKNDLLYERLEALASKRMHETVVLDDDFRKKRELHQDFLTGQSIKSGNKNVII